MILLPQCSCCASDPPPPESCECPDWCLYQIEILSPVAWGPRPLIPCPDENESGKFFYFDEGLYPPCEDEENCCGSVDSPIPGLVGPTRHRVYALANNGYARVWYSSNLDAIADVDFTLRCVETEGGDIEIYADISYGVFVPGLDGLVPRYPTRGVVKTASIKLDSACAEGVGITCSKPFDEASQFELLSGPLEFTVDASSAGLGEWDTEADDAVGDQSRITPCFEHLIENFSVTFRVTARESCEPPPPRCCCVDGAPLDTSVAGTTGIGECEGADFLRPTEPETCNCTVEVSWCGYTLTLSPGSGTVSDIYEIEPFECGGDSGPRDYNRVQLIGQWSAVSRCNTCVYDPWFKILYFNNIGNYELSYTARDLWIPGTGIKYNSLCGQTVNIQRVNSLVAGPNNDYFADSFPCAPCDELPVVTFDCNPAP